MGRWCRETPTDKIPYDVVGLNATAGFDVSKHRGRHRGAGSGQHRERPLPGFLT